MKTEDAVHKIVRNYSRLYAWLDVQDLQQEAVIACLTSARTWKPGGAPLEYYQARAVALTVRRFVKRESSPVSACAGLLDRLGAIQRDFAACLDDAGHLPYEDEHSPNIGRSHDVEGAIDRKRATTELRRLVALHGRVAGEVLLHERKPAEVARSMRVPVREVYRAALHARQALRESPSLQVYADSREDEAQLRYTLPAE